MSVPPTDVTPASSLRRELKRRVIEFVRDSSLEISPKDEDRLSALQGILPTGAAVYVAHTPKATLEDVVRVCTKLQATGLRGVPHIVVRRLAGSSALRDALQELRASGVEQVLLVAGDSATPVGKYASTLEVLRDTDFVGYGFTRIGICGHPEGHRAISPTALWSALRDKQAYASQTGIKVHIVTQFGLAPEVVCAWDRELPRRGISLPVHLGIAGPTSLPTLIKYAMQCGVGPSLQAVVRSMSATAPRPRFAATPDQMITGVLRNQSEYGGSLIAQPHFFSFGGALATARWLSAVRAGRFELRSDTDTFALDS